MNLGYVLGFLRQRDLATRSHPSPASAMRVADLLKRRASARQTRVEFSDFQETQPSMHDTEFGTKNGSHR